MAADMGQDELVAQIPGLRRYARALTGNSWAADDLVQDTLERACRKWRLWTVGSDLRAWLFTLMHNLHASGLRPSARRPAAGSQADLADVEAELQAPASGHILAMDLQRCLLKLPDEQRAVLLLVCMEDMSYQQVAQITGAPIGTVMSRLSRARTRLQALMDPPLSTPTRVDHRNEPPSPPLLRRLK